LLSLLAGSIGGAGQALAGEPGGLGDLFAKITQGALRTATEEGEVVECPLKHTDVRVRISGMIAHVRLVQTFHNPFKKKIEAIYVFPLSHTGAVNEMTMIIGDRRIVGVIKKRKEAEEIYKEALKKGKTAGLLTQERPNIFTQAVGNIPPGKEVKIEIAYVDVLKFDEGTYEFHFPMVVGPRFNPGKPTSKTPSVPPELKGKVGEAGAEAPPAKEGKGKPKGSGWSPDTDRVPDASRITPPVLKPGFRTGHDVRLTVDLDAGVPFRDLKAVIHRVHVQRDGFSRARVELSRMDAIPNKDFILRYAVMGETPKAALITHAPEKGEGTFLLMIQPKLEKALKEAPPRDLCFLVDVSGSMRGAPLKKVKESMGLLLEKMRDTDRVQVVTFASASQKLFQDYVPATKENIETALDFMTGVRAGGGTQMLEGVRMALADPDPDRVRIVLMLTDGYIENEGEIIGEAKTRTGENLRFWVLGIGAAPNRYLVDGVSDVTGGMGETLNINEDPKPLMKKILKRVQSAQLSGIALQWGPLAVHEIYPPKIPDLWADSPIVLLGRFKSPGQGELLINGTVEGEPVSMKVPVDFPERMDDHASLPTVWARRKVRLLNMEMQGRRYRPDPKRASQKELIDEITRIGLAHRLVTAYTSFVAVEEKEVEGEDGGPPERKQVPVRLPAGTKFGGFFKGSYWNSAIGIGGGSGGAFGARFGGRRTLRAFGGGRHTESAVLLGLVWLKNHQNPNGAWSSGKFMMNCKKGTCTGAGSGSDWETTGLSLLAFLGAGHTHKHGKFKNTVKSTLHFLKTQQNADGSFGAGKGADLRAHAILTLAWAEAFGLSNKSPLLQGPAQKAVDFLVKERTAGSGWGDGRGAPCDTVTTAWAVLALKAAKCSGLNVPEKAFSEASKGFDNLTDPVKCTVGFRAVGDGGTPAAIPGAHPLTPAAAATIGRIFLRGDKAKDDPDVLAAGSLLRCHPPEGDVKKGKVDVEYWYFGTLAMFQMGRSNWKGWNPPMKTALVPTQSKKDCENGSWNPVGAKGKIMGKVWVTALNILTLEIYYRYGRILKGK
jgi:Ca-activated chloride channel family protein